jgi:hypothetical protein
VRAACTMGLIRAYAPVALPGMLLVISGARRVERIMMRASGLARGAVCRRRAAGIGRCDAAVEGEILLLN